MKRIFTLLFLVAISSQAIAATTDDDGYNEYTIRESDIPEDAPRFQDFPSKVFTGKNAPPNLRSDSRTKMYRTRLAESAKEKPNFAGHYILARWGCGTDCIQISIIDAITGQVYHPSGVTTNVAVNVEDLLLDESESRPNFGSIKFRTNSRLLMLIGMPEESVERRGISYYVWEHNQLRLIRHVHKGWYP